MQHVFNAGDTVYRGRLSITTYQPDEPPLEMTVEHLRAVQTALRDAG